MSDFNGQTSQQIREGKMWTPRAHIIGDPCLRQQAEEMAPAIFHAIVEAAELARFEASPVFDSLMQAVGERERRLPDGTTFTVDAVGPYAFVAKLAQRVARGEIFESDINFAMAVRKGGTLAEWTFNAGRSLADKGLLSLS